jgi:hypothetical protein
VGARVQLPLRTCLECRSACLPAGRKAKSATTVPAKALAKAGQLPHIVCVITRYFIFSDSGTSHKDPDLDKWSNESNVLWMAQK